MKIWIWLTFTLLTFLLAAQTPEQLKQLAIQLEAADVPNDRIQILEKVPPGWLPGLVTLCMDRGQQFAREFEHEKALKSAHAASDTALKAGDRIKVAQADRLSGIMYYRLGQIKEALSSYQHGLEAIQDIPEEKLHAEMLRSIAVAERGLGDFQAAIEIDQRNLESYRRLGDKVGEIQVLTGIGNSYARLGDLRRAAEKFEQCLRLAEPLAREDLTYRSLENLGATYSNQGDWELALPFLERALRMKKESGADKRDLANSYINLAEAYGAVGRENSALQVAEVGLQLTKEAHDEVSEAYVRIARAGVYKRMKRYVEAMADLEVGLAINRDRKLPLETADCYVSLASLQLELGHPEAALLNAQKGAELARSLHSRDLLWRALASEAVAYGRLHKPEEALASYREGVSIVEELRKQLAGGDQQGLGFLHDKMTLFHGLMALHVQHGEDEEALRVAERAKAGVILDVLRAGHASITKAMTPAEQQREAELSARLAVLRSQPKAPPAMVQEAVHELDAFRAQLYGAHPELKIRRGESSSLALADLKGLLTDARTALLEFAVSPEAVYLFVIVRGNGDGPSLHIHKLPWKQESLSHEVEAFRQQLASRDLTYRTAAASLYRKLFAAAANELQGKTLLAIVPDGPLWSLPFQALVEPDGRHLIESRAVFYVPSLTVLAEMKRAGSQRSMGETTLLAMGDPQSRLPNTALEVAAVGKLYDKQALVFTGSEASESQWKSQAPSHRILHLATHGILNTSNPLYSYVQLAAGRGEDGVVEAREILDLDLHSDLVLLSACETGRGGFRDGEGLVGLSWALMVAGSPATVVSQWKVDSTSTTKLMVELHRSLRASGLAGKAAAMRTASLRLLKEDAFRHPFYWAGFVIVGDGF